MHRDNQLFLAPSRRWDGRVVGLYGGSFNPGHAGHVHVSHRALKAFQLDALWWLVSPRNPLKKAADIAPISNRKNIAQTLTKHPKIFVTTLEEDIAASYSWQTLQALQSRFKRTRFIWVIGADSLANFHLWKHWRRLFKTLPIAVIDRPGYSFKALSSPASRSFARHRVAHGRSRRLRSMQPPAWVFSYGPLHSGSATLIRKQRHTWTDERGA
ncbi:MAG: nicotinate-nucleotide adenylyltransferase [Pseudomonadota bacterium]